MKKETEPKTEETVVEEQVDKFEALTPEQKEKALELLEKDDKKIDWKGTGKRVGIGLAAVGTVVGSFLLGNSRGKKKAASAGVSTDTTASTQETV